MPQSGSTSNLAPAAFNTLLDQVCQRARKAGVFASCEVVDGRLECKADGSAEDAWYRLRWDGGRVWVSLEMADRWQSESIEADLVHTGDKLDELLEEEMVDLGYEGPRPTFEHFRSDDMLFTFRSPLPIDPGSPEAPEIATKVLLAYQACFAELGDMTPGEDD